MGFFSNDNECIRVVGIIVVFSLFDLIIYSSILGQAGVLVWLMGIFIAVAIIVGFVGVIRIYCWISVRLTFRRFRGY